MAYAMRHAKRSSCFFVLWLAMNHNAVTFLCNLFASVPDFFNKRAGCIIFFCLNTFLIQERFNFKRGTKSGYKHYIITFE